MIRWLFLALALPFAAFAQEMPARVDIHVNDFADAFSAEETAALRGELARLQAETGVEAVIVTVPSLDKAAPGQSLEGFATALFNAWGIGGGERNDGAMFLVAIGDREVRLELGAGYNRAFNDAAQQVLDRAVIPAFREAAYAQGLSAGIRSLRVRIVEPFLAGNPLPLADTVAPAPFPWVPAGLGAFVFLVIAGVSLRYRIEGLAIRLRACPSCGTRHLRRTRTTSQAPTIYNQGRQTVMTACLRCGHREITERVLPKKGQKSRKGSGGSGGGRSSGGGASGKW